MRLLLRQITSVFLLLVVFTASVQLAAARGHAPAVGTLEICTGSGPIHILVDENGEPTGGVMICPDYALAFYADPYPNVAVLLTNDAWQGLWADDAAEQIAAQSRPLSQARGPPEAV